MIFSRSALLWFVLIFALVAPGCEYALAGSVTANWLTRSGVTVEQAKEQAIRKALAEAVLLEGETLAGAPFSADRRTALVAYLSHKIKELVPGYSVSYGSETASEGSLTVDLHVDQEQLKPLFSNLKRFDSPYKPAIVQLELADVSPSERSLLESLAGACGISVQLTPSPQVKIWREGEIWKALITDAGAHTEEAQAGPEQVWYAVWDRYLTERVASAVLTASPAAPDAGQTSVPAYGVPEATQPEPGASGSHAVAAPERLSAGEEPDPLSRPAVPASEYPEEYSARAGEQAPAASSPEPDRLAQSPGASLDVLPPRQPGAEPRDSASLPVVPQGLQSVTIQGWTVPDGVTALDRQLQNWKDVLATSALATMEMRPEGIVATWSLTIQNGQALETRLREYCRERGLRYAFGH